ncbi:MAG TPA: hypothetical protein VMB49_20555 [Acidobacteriaceae bacterium]|nr:hypothetical protein [Acidobacteriaceae bacterium]
MRFSRQSVDDETLKAYLFGDLPADDIERLDELCIVDDDFAARLDSVETDLVDAYVRGELSGNDLAKFQKIYRSSVKLRQRVAFAESLKPHISQDPVRLAPVKPALASWLDIFRLPRVALAGGLAVLLVGGFVLVETMHLRENQNQVAVKRVARQAGIEQPEGAKPPKTPSENTSTAKNATPLVPQIPVSVVAFVLAPQMRGGTELPRFELPLGTGRVDLRLELEANDFPHYRVTLKNLKSDRPLWRSGNLAPVTKGESSALTVKVPAKLLTQGIYQVDLTGESANAEAEFVSSYSFRIVTR